MSVENKQVPKAVTQQVAELEKKMAEHEEAIKALLTGMRDVIKFNGREHMPEGDYMGEAF